MCFRMGRDLHSSWDALALESYFALAFVLFSFKWQLHENHGRLAATPRAVIKTLTSDGLGVRTGC